VVAYRTVSAGATWTPETLPRTEGSVDGVACPSVSTCYAVFELNEGPTSPLYLALSTTNFGVSWESEFVASGASGVYDINDLSCPAVNTCVMAGDVRLRLPVRGDYGIMFTRTNGGRSWARRTIPGFPGQVEAIACASASRCEMAGYSSVNQGGATLGTTDAGHHWQRTLFPARVGELSGLACPTESRCVAVGSDNQGGVAASFSTSDWGKVWTPQGLPGRVNQPIAISCATGASCVVISGSFFSAHGTVISTRNAWATWTVSNPPHYLANLTSLECPSVSLCYVVGETVGSGVNLVALHLAGRTAWVREHLGSERGAIRVVDCSSQSTCMAVGATQPGHRLVGFRTVNGGRTWTAVDFPTRSIVPSVVACPSALTCIIAGGARVGAPFGSKSRDVALRTTDGGRSWDVYPLPGGIGPLDGLACTSATVCDLVGSRLHLSKGCRESLGFSSPSQGIPPFDSAWYVGVALRTVNAGAKWLTVKLPGSVGELDGIACASSSSCTAFGRSPLRDPVCLSFPNGSACSWRPGDPVVANTTDNGETWTTRRAPSGLRELDGVTCPMTSLCELVGYTATDVQVLEAK
jgi:photosystem II stability/assembly factor-like uncharacterized protein